MVEALLVLILGLIPPLMSIWVMRKAEAQARERLRRAVNATTLSALRNWQQAHASPDHHYVEGIGYMVGDITCRFNARSSYIRCAVNPCGPCQECSQYEPIEFA